MASLGEDVTELAVNVDSAQQVASDKAAGESTGSGKAKMDAQRVVKAAMAERKAGGTARSLQRARKLTKRIASGLQRPATSRARTMSQHRGERVYRSDACGGLSGSDNISMHNKNTMIAAGFISFVANLKHNVVNGPPCFRVTFVLQKDMKHVQNLFYTHPSSFAGIVYISI